jgi:hypothetical protein
MRNISRVYDRFGVARKKDGQIVLKSPPGRKKGGQYEARAGHAFESALDEMEDLVHGNMTVRMTRLDRA